MALRYGNLGVGNEPARGWQFQTFRFKIAGRETFFSALSTTHYYAKPIIQNPGFFFHVVGILYEIDSLCGCATFLEF
jgi:hypothetical protein